MVEVEEDCPIREGAMIDVVLTEPSIVIMVMDITRRHTHITLSGGTTPVGHVGHPVYAMSIVLWSVEIARL